MPNTFYRHGATWHAQKDGDSRVKHPAKGEYVLIADGNMISIVGAQSGTTPIFLDTLVTSIQKNNDGDFYTSVEDFETSTAEFFDTVPAYSDNVGRMSLNSVFGEKLVGIRRPSVSAQFQYGFPASDAAPEVVATGTIDIIESKLRGQTGTATNGKARIANKKALRYIPGQEAYLYFTAVFTAGVANSYQRAGLFDDQNGFFIGFEGAVFGATRRRNGVDYFEAIDTGTIFNDEEFNPAFGNIYKISFGYLGFATVNFEILHPKGYWVGAHKIEFPNSQTGTHITNTNLPPALEVANTGNTSNLSIQTASFSGGVVDGMSPATSQNRYFSYANQAIAVASTYQTIATFRNKVTFNSIKNYIESALLLLNPATDLSKNSTWELRKNMTVTNTPTWSDVSTDSIIEISSNATVTAGSGSLMFAFSMGKTDRLFEDVGKYSLELFPGETATFVIKTPSGTNGTFDFAIRWAELF